MVEAAVYQTVLDTATGSRVSLLDKEIVMSDLYVPEQDITMTRDDGMTVLVAPKGIPMLRSQAEAMGGGR